MKRTLVVPTQNDHTLTLVDDGEEVTLRIAKGGHNRAIAKLLSGPGSVNLADIVAFLSEASEGQA